MYVSGSDSNWYDERRKIKETKHFNGLGIISGSIINIWYIYILYMIYIMECQRENIKNTSEPWPRVIFNLIETSTQYPRSLTNLKVQRKQCLDLSQSKHQRQRLSRKFS